MHLVAFACPPHFHIVQLAIRQARLCHPEIHTVTIVWDDVYLAQKLKSLDLAQQLATVTGANIIQHNDFDCCRDEVNGWLRQQYIKLHLHQYLPGTEWLLLDGDTVLRNSLVVKDSQGCAVFQADMDNYYEPAVQFLKQALKINHFAPGDSWMTPSWLAERSVLESLHQWFNDHYNQNFITYFQRYKKDTSTGRHDHAPLNEVDVYAVFADRVLRHPVKRIASQLRCCLPGEFVEQWHTSTMDLCLGGRDYFDLEFWQQQGIDRCDNLDRILNA